MHMRLLDLLVLLAHDVGEGLHRADFRLVIVHLLHQCISFIWNIGQVLAVESLEFRLRQRIRNRSTHAQLFILPMRRHWRDILLHQRRGVQRVPLK